ncbi:hypothetical protein ACVWWI_003169 [Bradyrhizobium sp. USDA 3686]
MSQRKFMGLVGGATASGPGIALASQRSANAAAEPAYDDEQEFPLIIANIPATPRQKAWAVGVAVLLIVLAAVIAPFARIQLGQINGFVPVLQTALALAEFITAALLFAQFSIQPQRALLALASGYVFSGSFAFLQTLAFPNGYASAGVIGDGLNSPAWLYVLWHATFPAAIFGYGFMKDHSVGGRPGRPATAAIIIVVGCIGAAVAGLTWIVNAKAEWLPNFYVNDVRHQTPLGNQVNLMLLLWNLTALTVLFARMRTILDLWLMVTLLAYLPNFLVAIIGSSVRFTIGWYAARGFRSRRQLHVADRIAHRNDVYLFAPCQRHCPATTRTSEPASQHRRGHWRDRPRAKIAIGGHLAQCCDRPKSPASCPP